MTTTLCVLFGHPFPKNIPVLRELYGSRFSDVIFLQPLVRSEDRDVLTVYRGSYNFHGMIADAFARLISKRSDHYVFIQDDVLLNPLLNEKNIAERLSVEVDQAFIPKFAPLGGPLSWDWYPRLMWKLFYPMNPLTGSGVENLWAQLPDAERMRDRLAAKYGFNFEPVRYDRRRPPIQQLFDDPVLSETAAKVVLEGLFAGAADRSSLELPYPFCFGLSDFFVVGGEALAQVAHLLGVMAAAEVFVEVAVPTALLTAAESVRQQHEVGLSSDWLWGGGRDGADPAALAKRFREDLLFVHPVKISTDGQLLRDVMAHSAA
jgi:hypothetical protein